MERLLIKDHKDVTPASLSDVEVGIIEAKMGVAENGAVWVTEEELKVRALPFICEHLVALVKEEDIVSNMHEAYERIREGDYGFGVFIAGPSKTADIEQSLVLGAHGPKTMTVLIRTKE
jgi:L-lactate dehydrogenase complex protein LldG